MPVLREGAAFTRYINKLIRAGGLADGLGFYDFSLDRNTKWRLLYFLSFQSQRDHIKSTTHEAFNPATKTLAVIETPDRMLNGAYEQGLVATVLDIPALPQ